MDQIFLENTLSSEEEAELAALMMYPNGMGLTAAEIAQSPEVGIWKDRTDIKDSVDFVNDMRRQSRERRLNRD
jgi:hypothetical protein